MAKKKNGAAVVKLSDHRRNIIKLLERLSSRYSRWTVFSDFNELLAISIANGVRANSKATVDERENRYRAIMGKYTAEERKLFPAIAAELALEMEGACPKYRDVLGETFHAMNLQDEAHGQFFTPQSVCDLMSRASLGGVAEALRERGFVRIYEPCVGAGANLLGVINALFVAGYNPCMQALFIADDLDARCVHMAYIQLSLAGVPAIIRCKDSLTGESFGAPWFTPVFIFDLWGFRLKVERMVAIPAEPKYEQLTLF